MAQRSVEEVVRAYYAAMEKEDVELIRSFFADDILFEDRALSRSEKGLERCMAFWSEYMKAWPWKTFAFDFVFQGNRYAVRWRTEGRQVADLHGIPCTHKTFEFEGASFGTVVDGKITHHVDYYDSATLMRQLGLS